MTEIFSRQDSTKKPAIIVRRILDLIDEGTLLPGEKLPNEMEIVRQSDISRASVREALSALELMGIIKRVPGEGTYISERGLAGKYTPKNILDKFLEDTERVGGSFEALEARMAIEPSVTMMAARRAEPQQIARMEALVEASVGALASHDAWQFMDLDGSFHIAVAEATNNETLMEISRDLLKRADVHMWQRYKEDLGLLEKTLESHRQILQAIKERDPAKAAFYSEKHLARCV
ncbi:MAG: FCD domain-containing protein [Synergistaceae bacterium]|nr:FCD domain-containing protein [Synergistaceae bacterium]